MTSRQKLALLVALVLALVASPATAEVVSNDYDAYGFRLPYTFNSSARLSVEGSVFSGDSYKLVITGKCPAGETPVLAYAIDNNFRKIVTQESFEKSGSSFRFQSVSLSANVGGAEEKYAGIYSCSGLYSQFKTNTIGVFFEGPVGSPSNVQVTISGQTALFSWTAARGATSYQVLAQDPRFSCVTKTTNCSIAGLPIGSFQDFTLIATDGMDNQTFGIHKEYFTLDRVQIAPKISISVAWASNTFQVGTALEASITIAGKLTQADYFWYACDRPVDSDATTNLLPSGCFQRGQHFSFPSPNPGSIYKVTYTPTSNDVGKYIVGAISGESATSLTGAVLGSVNSVLVAESQNSGVSPIDSETSTGVSPIDSDTNTYSTLRIALSATQKALTSAQKALIGKFLKANKHFIQISCDAKTIGVKKSTTEIQRIRALAKSACSYSNSVVPNMFSRFSANQGSVSGKIMRYISLTGF